MFGWISRFLSELSPHPVAHPPLPDAVNFTDLMIAEIISQKPELEPALYGYGTWPRAKFGDFLDEHFPIEGGWGVRPAGSYYTLQTLRALREREVR